MNLSSPSRPVRLALRLLAPAFATLLAGPALATSPDPGRCDVDALAPQALYDDTGPARPMTLPANVPSFLAASSKAPLPTIRLLDVSAEPPLEVPLRVALVASETSGQFTFQSFALSPSIAVANEPGGADVRSLLEAGHDYRFEYLRTCYSSGDPNQVLYGPVEESLAFRAAPAAPLPTSAGVIAELNRDSFIPDSYVALPAVNIVRVTFTPSNELLPWADGYAGRLVIDGELQGKSVYDSPLGPSILRDESAGGAPPPLAEITCRAHSLDPSARERHTLAYAAYPIGFDAPAVVSNTLELDLPCTSAPPREPPVAVDQPASDNEGCAVASPLGRPAGWAALAALLAPAAFVARRRRRGPAAR
ncbi:MAG TPA: hypothetical protein VFS00_15970 [Polyangiaceae bacterium]|nr:hypothetical protein [Polyangiaceae bacterium]